MRALSLPIISTIFAPGLVAIALTGCASSPSTTGNELVGTWTGTIAGYEGVDAVYVDKPFKIVV